MTINLENRIIKIPNTCKTIMQGDTEEKIIVKVPRILLTDNLEKSKIFIITKLNDNEPIEKELEFLYTDEEENVNYYCWNLEEKHTFEEGRLEIQFKIERGEKQEPDIPDEPEQTKDSIVWGWSDDAMPPPPWGSQSQWMINYVGYKKTPISIIVMNKNTLELVECVYGQIRPDEDRIHLRFYPENGDYIIIASSMDGTKVVSKEFENSSSVNDTLYLEVDFEKNTIINQGEEDEPPVPPVPTPGDDDPPTPTPGGDDEPTPTPSSLVSFAISKEAILNDETNENEEEKDPDFEPTPDEELDPDYLIPYGNNNNGIWYSYKNYFYINKSLISD